MSVPLMMILRKNLDYEILCSIYKNSTEATKKMDKKIASFIVAYIEDDIVVITVVEVGHRKDI